MRPYSYLLMAPGKQIRTRFIHAFNRWYNLDTEKLAVVTDVINILHNASLLVDDVQDSTNLRRGAPASHRVFGVPQTINCANYMYFKAYQLLLPHGIQVLKIMNGTWCSCLKHAEVLKAKDEMLHLHEGQGMELYWRDTFICPSEADYFNMVKNSEGSISSVLSMSNQKHRNWRSLPTDGEADESFLNDARSTGLHRTRRVHGRPVPDSR